MSTIRNNLLKSLPFLAVGCSSALGVVVNAPFIIVPSGTYVRAADTLIGCTTPGATVRYTMNGQEPTVNDPIAPSPGILSFGDNITIKAKAWVGSDVSPTTSASYVFTGDISAGRLHTVMMDAVGNAYAWGAQSTGRLANLTTAAGTSVATMSYDAPPGFASPVRDAISIAAGEDQSLIVNEYMLPFGVGNNSNGQVGDTTLTDRSGFVNVSDSVNFLASCKQVTAGTDFSGALGSSGVVWTWGIETGGRLGNGAILGNRRYAGQVIRGDIPGDPVLGGIVDIEFGAGFGMAREGSTGRVWTWGHNGSGQLGQGTLANRSRALPVMLNSTTELTDATAISGGQLHAAVVRWKTGDANLQGSVWSFGERGAGRLGNNVATTGNVSYPVQAQVLGGAALQGIVAVSAGASHTLALDANGYVWSWGNNAKGQLGNNGTADRAYAAKVRNQNNTGDLSGIVAIAAGGQSQEGFSVAIDSNGVVYSWGSNTDSQLGTPADNLDHPLPLVPSVWPAGPQVSTVTATPTVTTGTAPGAATVAVGRTMDPQDGAGVKYELWLNGTLHTTRTPAVPADWNVNLLSLAAGNYVVVAVLYDSHGNMVHSDQQSFTIN